MVPSSSTHAHTVFSLWKQNVVAFSFQARPKGLLTVITCFLGTAATELLVRIRKDTAQLLTNTAQLLTNTAQLLTNTAQLLTNTA